MNRTSSRSRRSFDMRSKRRRSSISPTKYREVDFPLTPKARSARPSSSSGSSITSTISSRNRSISSRLQKLATPRASSTWNKPIASKYSRIAGRVSTQDRAKSRNERSKDTEWVKIGLDLPDDEGDSLNNGRSIRISKTWKAQLSPKLQKILSSISPATTTGAESKSECQEYDCELWNIEVNSLDHGGCLDDGDRNKRASEASAVSDILSTPIIASLMNHPFHVSCPPASVVKYAVDIFQREVIRLADELSAKDQYITELKAKVKDRDDRQSATTYRESRAESIDNMRASYIAVQRSDRSLSPESVARRQSATSTYIDEIALRAAKGTRCLASRESMESYCTLQNGEMGDLVTRLSGELDSKIEELDELRLEHEMEIGQIHSEIYKKNNLTPPTSPLNSGEECRTPPKQLVSSVKKLRRSYNDMRRSSLQSIQIASNELDKNYDKIMCYVREEVATLREEEINAAHGKLQTELEEARSENTILEARLIQMQEERKVCDRRGHGVDMSDANSTRASTKETSSQTEKKCKERVPPPSPIPTLESWSQFCMRFRQTLDGSDGMPKSKKKLNQEGLLQADNLLRELSFHNIAKEKDDEIFVDARSSTDDEDSMT